MDALSPSQLAWLALLFGLACVALGLWLAGLLRSSDQHERVRRAQVLVSKPSPLLLSQPSRRRLRRADEC